MSATSAGFVVEFDWGHMKCIHGIDSRFCANCNRPPAAARGTAGKVPLDDVLRFLNEQRFRATYAAVAQVVGATPRALKPLLGPHRPEASWIVNAGNGLPTDYSEDEWHPALLSQAEIITTGRALALRLSKWKSDAAQLGHRD